MRDVQIIQTIRLQMPLNFSKSVDISVAAGKKERTHQQLERNALNNRKERKLHKTVIEIFLKS